MMKFAFLLTVIISCPIFSEAYAESIPLGELRTLLKKATSLNLNDKIKQGYKIEKVINITTGEEIFVLVKA